MKTPDQLPSPALIAEVFDIAAGQTEAEDRVVWRDTRQVASVPGSNPATPRLVVFGVFLMEEPHVLRALTTGTWPNGAAPLPMKKLSHPMYHAAQTATARSVAHLETRALSARVGGSAVTRG